jgi:hypothetical protein
MLGPKGCLTVAGYFLNEKSSPLTAQRIFCFVSIRSTSSGPIVKLKPRRAARERAPLMSRLARRRRKSGLDKSCSCIDLTFRTFARVLLGLTWSPIYNFAPRPAATIRQGFRALRPWTETSDHPVRASRYGNLKGTSKAQVIPANPRRERAAVVVHGSPTCDGRSASSEPGARRREEARRHPPRPAGSPSGRRCGKLRAARHRARCRGRRCRTPCRAPAS